jgi:hypothetical protein
MLVSKKVVPARVPLSWRKVVTAGAIAACAPAVTASTLPAERSRSIEWSIQRDGSRADGSKIQLTIESRWGAGNQSIWSEDRSITDLPGLGAAQVTGPTTPVRFLFVHDAGRLDCSGVAGNLTGRGACSFAMNPQFSAYLQQHGIGAPTPDDAFTLTMSGVGRELIEAMQEIGYTRPTAGQLASMGIQGISADYVRGLARSGYRLRSADDLVDLRIHGVTPDYVRQIAAIGPQFANFGAEDLVNLSIHGARPDLVRAYAAFTRGTLNPDDIVDLAIHGVSAEYLEQLAALGYRDLTADDLVNLQIHGVTPDYIRRLQQKGVAHISAEQLVRLRLAGFEPNAR